MLWNLGAMKSKKSMPANDGTQSILRLYTWMGACLMFVQLAERMLQLAIETVLDDSASKTRLKENRH
jgi:hypothetical protein